MNRSNTLKSTERISQIFTSGERFSDRSVRVIVASTAGQRDLKGRVAFIAGKKLGGAVVRNKVKRKLRAAADCCQLPLEGFDVLLIGTPKTREISVDDLTSSIRRCLDKLGKR